MKIVVTGAYGFLGWHLRVRLRALTEHKVVALGRQDFANLYAETADADAVVHVAGVNRGRPEVVEGENIALAEAVARAVRQSPTSPRVVYANSVRAGDDTAYGRGKAAARDLLGSAAVDVGAPLVDVRLPNLFGEHGKPDYNSFVATFVRAAVEGQPPHIADRPVQLLHAQSAAQELIEAAELGSDATIRPAGTTTSVAEVWEKLRQVYQRYRRGEIPPLPTRLDVDLFNTLRTAMFPRCYPISLVVHRDQRGDLVECVRSHGGQGQCFVSSTVPGVTRGDHFHLEKVERFVVVRGRARIALRRLFHDDVVSFEVSGTEPCVVDMPTMWAHNITNIGDDELVTFFWTHTLFDPSAADTFAEKVEPHVERTYARAES